MKNEKIAILLIILILVSAVFLFIQSIKSVKDEERIVGTWFASNTEEESTISIYYFFLSDKTLETVSYLNGVSFSDNGTWRIVDDKLLIISIEPYDITLICDYYFSDNYNTLTLIDSEGEAWTVKKVELSFDEINDPTNDPTPADTCPSVTIEPNYASKRLTVKSVSHENLRWRDFDIRWSGDLTDIRLNCGNDTLNILSEGVIQELRHNYEFKAIVTSGDYINITGTGTLSIRFVPSSCLVGVWTFT